MANSNGWGDGSANNAIGWGQGANNAVSWGSSHATSNAGLTNIVGGVPVDADYQAFITAAAITNPTQQSAVETLVAGLKTDGIWSKMKAIYPFVGGTASAHKFNLKDPRDLDAAFRLTFNGGITHSATGALPNGTTGYADTKYKPSIQIVDTDSTHFSAYFRTNDILGTKEIGANTIYGSDGDSFSDAEGQYLFNLTAASYFANGYGFGGSFVDSLAGQYIINRNGANSITAYKNGTLKSTITPSNQGLPSVNMFLMGMNEYYPDLSASNTYYGKREIAFATLGTGLSNTDASNLYTRIQAFQTTLGRSIGTQTVSDADAQAFVTAANIQDQVQAQAINTLTTGMKADGLWTKMKAIYPFVGGTATSHKFNLKDPRDLDAAFRLVFNGGWTHSSLGALPNGTNAYADTKFTPSVVQSVNSNGLGFYGTTNVGGGADPVVMGSFNSTGQASTLTMSVITVNSRLNGNTWGFGFAGASGQYDVHRTDVANTVIYKNGTSLSGVYNSGGTLPTVNIYLGTLNLNGTAYSSGWTVNQFRFTYFSDGLTAGNITNLRTRVQAFQTSLSRAI